MNLLKYTAPFAIMVTALISLFDPARAQTSDDFWTRYDSYLQIIMTGEIESRKAAVEGIAGDPDFSVHYIEEFYQVEDVEQIQRLQPLFFALLIYPSDESVREAAKDFILDSPSIPRQAVAAYLDSRSRSEDQWGQRAREMLEFFRPTWTGASPASSPTANLPAAIEPNPSYMVMANQVLASRDRAAITKTFLDMASEIARVYTLESQGMDATDAKEGDLSGLTRALELLAPSIEIGTTGSLSPASVIIAMNSVFLHLAPGGGATNPFR